MPHVCSRRSAFLGLSLFSTLLVSGCELVVNQPPSQSETSPTGDAGGGGGGGGGGTPGPSYPSAASNEWVWVSGSNARNQNGVYSGTALPGGREYGFASWTDASGNLWLFGGNGYGASGGAGKLNDLWKYDVNSGAWSFVSGTNAIGATGDWGTLGVEAASNVPSGRSDMASAIDASGNLWLFGGLGKDSAGASGKLGDLWKFNASTLRWTWMGGTNLKDVTPVYDTAGAESATAHPGTRNNSYFFVDDTGRPWIFGGMVSGNSNPSYAWQSDFWKLNLSNGRWTYVNGSVTNSPLSVKKGSHGTQGVAFSGNWPGARHSGAAWASSDHKTFWIFGGEGTDSAQSEWVMNDLWKFDTASGIWTWMKGSSLSSQSGTYGTRGVSAASNLPGGRVSMSGARDSSGNFWLFGGWGKASGAGDVSLNDLWKYNPTNNEWTWMSGSSSGNQAGSWGTQGVAAASNVPGGRDGFLLFGDSFGGVWLFGGLGNDASALGGKLSDLWYYKP